MINKNRNIYLMLNQNKNKNTKNLLRFYSAFIQTFFLKMLLFL